MKKSRKNDGWAEAKRICRLAAEDVEKAKKLGFQPKSLIKNVPSPSQRWKMPVREWVRDLYEKKFGRVRGKSLRPAAKDDGMADKFAGRVVMVAGGPQAHPGRGRNVETLKSSRKPRAHKKPF